MFQRRLNLDMIRSKRLLEHWSAAYVSRRRQSVEGKRGEYTGEILVAEVEGGKIKCYIIISQ